MHAGARNDTDGWYLASFDHPAGGRSHTACSGIRAEEMLAGGKQKMPPLKSIARDLSAANRRADARHQRCLRPPHRGRLPGRHGEGGRPHPRRDAVCILSTIPPHPAQLELAKTYNEALRKIAKEKSIPLIDYEKEILKRRPDDWNGTLLQKNDVHPTASQGGATAASAPTADNLKTAATSFAAG